MPVMVHNGCGGFTAGAVDTCGGSTAAAVDANATRANRISQDREKEENSRSDDSRHLERCTCGLEFVGVMVFIFACPFCLLALTAVESRPCRRGSVQTGEVCLYRHLVFHLEESHFLS
jgi:hypothetical protein